MGYLKKHMEEGKIENSESVLAHLDWVFGQRDTEVYNDSGSEHDDDY